MQDHDLPDSYYNGVDMEIIWLKREYGLLRERTHAIEDETHRSADARKGP